MSYKQLSGMDASFLYMETPETPMHVAGCTLYELPEGFEGSFHEHFKKFFAGRVHLIPIFNKKLAKTVFQMDHPGWVEADVDLDYHIQSATVPAPGAFKQMEDLIGDLHSTTLDRTKPLWQFHVIEGLADGRVALYSKVHHAAVDGGAGMVITQALYDLGPVPREVEPPKPREASRKPSVPERAVLGIHDMATNMVRQQLKIMEALPKAAGQVADLVAPALKGGLSLPQMLAPKTAFNGTIGAERSYAARSVSLKTAKAICKATGVKINDVVMATCSGALRAYLDEKHQLPDAALIAFVPISMREAGNTDLNNQVFGMNTPLATNYGDPVKRLTKINAESRSTKTMAASVKDLSTGDFTVLGAPMLLPGLMQLFGQTKLADVAPNIVNVCISNNAGPPFPLYCAGAKVSALYPVSIPVHGVGVNFTVQSYIDHLDFGVTCCKTSVPDVDRMGDLLIEAFDELAKAVLGDEAVPTAEAAPSPKPAAPAPKQAPKPAPKKRAPAKKPAAKAESAKPAAPAKAAPKSTPKKTTATAKKTDAAPAKSATSSRRRTKTEPKTAE
ncbi:MAG: wax ester/triacylglycerol synthase family O-acyltransferase [Pseudomonadota bacterium]